jgi:hypothetical protein
VMVIQATEVTVAGPAMLCLPAKRNPRARTNG